MRIGKSTAYWVTGYSLLVLMIGTNLPSPLYAVYMRLWHFSPAVLTLIFATYALVLIPALLTFGRLSDRLGRRRVLFSGLLLAAIGSLVFAGATGVAWLFLARAVQGVAVGMMSGAATAALVELHPGGDSRKAALIASIATAGGTALGPALAGVLAQYGPEPLTLPYVIQALALLPAILLIAWIPETVTPRSAQTARPPGASFGIPRAIREPFTLAAATGFVAWAVTALFMALIPAYTMKLLDTTNLALAGGVVFAMLAISSVAQMTLRRTPARAGIVTGLLLLAPGLAGLVLSVPGRSVTLIVLSTAIIGLGQGLSFMGSMALVNQIAPTEQRGSVLSTFYVIIYLGVGIPIIGVGAAATAFGLYRAVEGFGAAIALAGVTVAYLVSRMPRVQLSDA